MEGDDSSDSNPEMAECGACRAVIPVDSTSCSACNVSFTGVAEDEMGECGSCGSLVSLDSKSCNQCGVHFVLDDLTTALSDWMKDEGLSITDLFSKVDTDGDASLSSDEIRDALLDRKLAFLPHQDLDRFLAQIDLNDDGQISFAELAAALSMPWARPAEKIVLEPEPEEEEAEEEADDSEDDSDDDEDESEDDDSDEEDSDDDEDDDDSDDDDSDDDDSDDDEEDSDDEDESEDDDSDEEDSDDDEDDDDSDDDEDDDDSEDDEDDDDSDDDEEDSEDEEGSEDEEETTDDEADSEDEAEPKDEGPAEWQRFLMQHFENIFPVFYLGVGIFILAFLLNAFGLFVDGSGGSVAFDGTTDAIYQDEDGAYVSVSPGDIYPCDQSIQESNCKNSLTPFAGENGSNSMPAGFYWDGIFFMILGLAGMGGIFYLQMQIKAMRSEHRRQKRDDENDSESDSDEDASDDDDEGSDDDSDDEGSDDDSDDEDSDDDDSNDDDPSDDDDSDDEDDDDEGDGIEIGTRVGVEDEDGDWYGVVTEFDEDEDAVVVKRKDDDEEYVVDWDALFLDD